MLDVTLIEVKTYLGVSGSDDDVRLQSIIDSVNAKVESNIGDISLGLKTMTIKNSAVHNKTITLNIIKPTDITEINGYDFTGKISGTDYLIKNDGEAIINGLSTYISNDFGFFTVKFNAGYLNTPKTLISLVSNYVGYIYSQDLGKNIVSEGLGPRNVDYQENNIDGQDLALKTFMKGLNQFIPLAFKIY